MLKDSFFSIQSRTQHEDTIIYNVNLNKEHEVYKGHFPGQPIAPGVCLAQMIKEICETELNSELKMISSRNMKFMAVLNPFENENVIVSININEDNKEYRVKANCKNEEISFFKIDAKYCK